MLVTVYANGFLTQNAENVSHVSNPRINLFVDGNHCWVNADFYFGVKAVFHISWQRNLKPAQSERRERSNAASHGEQRECKPTGGFGCHSSGSRQRVCTLNRPPSRCKNHASSANISADGAFLQSEHVAIYVSEYELMCIYQCETHEYDLAPHYEL